MELAVNKEINVYRISHNDEAGRSVSRGSCVLYKAHLNGAVVNAIGIGGVGTDPEYRRAGLVRAFLEKANEIAALENCPVTFLHPFSFAYYRKYGFERVADHRILEMPIGALDFVPRYEKLTRCTPQDAPVLEELYNRFAADRNIMFVRSGYPWPLEDPARRIYLSHDENNCADGYILYDTENHLNVNHMERGVLHVRELVFTTPAALDKLFGFMRMFDGELERIVLHNTAMTPEAERRLRHYTHTKITVLPDLMVRINDVEAVLKAVRYPDAAGSFTVKVTDAGDGKTEPQALGIWRVSYHNGTADVLPLAQDAACDLCADRRAFAQLVFGYESYGADAARYMPGVVLHDDCADFFRAFPNRPCGLFEHF